MSWRLETGGAFHEWIGGRGHHNHRGQVGRLLKDSDPLVVSQVRGANSTDFASRPRLLSAPFDGVVTVWTLVAIGCELAVRVPATPHIHGDVDVASCREVATQFDMASSRSTFIVR